MISFLQTDGALRKEIRASGCALLDCAKLAAQAFTQDEMNRLYDELLAVKFIDEECTLLSWDNVLNGLDARLHFKREIILGMEVAQVYTPVSNPEQYTCVNELEILKWWLTNVKEQHHTVGDGKGATAWDSMARPDIMAAYAKPMARIIVSVKEVAA